MAALDRMKMAVSVDFRYRIEYMMYQIADIVLNEDPEAPNHATKLAAAKKIATGQVNIAEFAKLVITDDALGAKIDAAEEALDDDIRSAVISKLTSLAKAIL